MVALWRCTDRQNLCAGDQLQEGDGTTWQQRQQTYGLDLRACQHEH